MHQDLILTFCDPVTKDNEFDVPFTLANNSTSIKWLRLLYKDIYLKKKDWNNNRFCGFDDKDETKNRIVKEMNDLIKICNEERPGHFELYADKFMNQEDFNKLHVWFEIYRGELNIPHKFFVEGSDRFKYAIERFNQLIHLWEKTEIFYENDEVSINVDINFPSTIELSNEDYLNYEIDRTKNTIYASYFLRGKNITDVWGDDDDHVGDANVRPPKYLSSSFDFRSKQWNKKTKILKEKSFKSWFKQHSNWLNSLGYYWGDSKCALGWLPIAHSNINNIKEIIQPRQYLKAIKIFE